MKNVFNKFPVFDMIIVNLIRTLAFDTATLFYYKDEYKTFTTGWKNEIEAIK